MGKEVSPMSMATVRFYSGYRDGYSVIYSLEGWVVTKPYNVPLGIDEYFTNLHNQIWLDERKKLFR
jgi:hypothetical protein